MALRTCKTTGDPALPTDDMPTGQDRGGCRPSPWPSRSAG